MDANFSMGSEGAVGLDLKAKLLGRPGAPLVIDFVAGLGGREINADSIFRMVERAEEIFRSGMIVSEPEWMDLNPAMVP
jgi:pyruvate ferredoxin oxidoreductase alpha subunit